LIKNIYRFIKYKEHRQKLVRERKIKPIQTKLFNKEYNTDTTKKLIVFIVPGADRFTGNETMSGGVISILSIAEETKKIFDKNKEVSTIVCTINEDNLLLKYQNFENNFNIYDYKFVSYFNNLSEIIVHIPDYMAVHFYNVLTKKNIIFFNETHQVHFNIMNQNINLMPLPKEMEPLKNLASLTTVTTAHQQYSTQYHRNFYGVPLHKLSVWISPEQYTFKQKNEKENLLIYSPDEHLDKEKIINKLKEVGGLKLQMIKGITYTEFKEVISKAKWALTFGEGLDGYILEPIFSGAIGFAVYNEDFFTAEYKRLKTIYNSYDDLYNRIVEDINFLDNDKEYKDYQQIQYNICKSQYSSEVYKKNIEKFYKQEYTFK
jgi:hypothetical protein